MKITVPAEFEGRLLRSYLKNTLAISAKTLAHLKAVENGITVNGERVTVRYALRAGDILELADVDIDGSPNIIPTDMPLSVLYEDEYVTVLNKPPYMPTHPSHGHITDTLANALAFRYASEDIPFVFRPLGRLDRNTSGVVIAAKTRTASGFLGGALMRGEVKKRYIALVHGGLCDNGEIHSIEVPIKRAADSIIIRTACSMEEEGAEYALTNYRVLLSNNNYSLLLCEPRTGRTHQLRVHLSHIGHPIVGDDIYGGDISLIGRHALHAISITIPLPFFRAANGSDKTAPRMRDTDLKCDDGVLSLLSSRLNFPTDDGLLCTFAPLPEDMSRLVRWLFCEHKRLREIYPLFCPSVQGENV
ncbi:MAG: RluA family pseudouridine synthase [Ruminococcaceae bacterium]|nr:RluA family pseudouridine synthase [Oscillospiraceae bacterium]